MQERKISEISTAELKIAVYDLMEELEKTSNTVTIIKRELASRAQKAQENKKMDETTPVVEEVALEAETQQEVEAEETAE